MNTVNFKHGSGKQNKRAHALKYIYTPKFVKNNITVKAMLDIVTNQMLKRPAKFNFFFFFG